MANPIEFAESCETEVLRSQTRNIEIALIPDLHFLACEMNASFLLSDAELSQVKAVPSFLTEDQKASKVVDSLKRMVKLNWKNFKKFVDILRKKPQLFESVIELLMVEEKKCLGQNRV